MPYLNSPERGDLFTRIIVKTSEEPTKRPMEWKGEELIKILALIIASVFFLLRFQGVGTLTLGDLFIPVVIFLVCYVIGWFFLNMYRRRGDRAK